MNSTNHTSKTKETQRLRPSDFANITINPDGNVPEGDRETVLRRAIVKLNIAADGGQGSLPSEFHEPSIRWALRQADMVVIWADDPASLAPALETGDAMVNAVIAPHVRPGCRIVQINVQDQNWGAWFQYADKHTKPGTQINCVLNPVEAKR
jgi:hypothetical protein